MGQHLQLLHPAHAAFRIKYHNSGAGDICKAGHGSLPRITGCRRQNHDFIAHMILLCGCNHQIRKNRQRHIFKSNGLSMEQLQEIHAAGLFYGSNFLCVKFVIVGTGNAAL